MTATTTTAAIVTSWTSGGLEPRPRWILIGGPAGWPGWFCCAGLRVHGPVKPLVELGLVKPAILIVPGQAVGHLGSFGVRGAQVTAAIAEMTPGSWSARTGWCWHGRSDLLGRHVLGQFARDCKELMNSLAMD
jgi:hypothetical protein